MVEYQDPTPISSVSWTMGVIVLCVGILLALEFIVLLNNKPGDTISEVVLYWAMQHPVVPFVIGILCGHWFWPQHIETTDATPPVVEQIRKIDK